jgi:putative heme-binding domain-containing protein
VKLRLLLLPGILLAVVTSFVTPDEPKGSVAQPKGLSPADAAKTFKVPEDLRLEQVLAEPVVAQPVSMSFDEKGRLWVVQYQQYPYPAGLKVMSRDKFWRVVYDKVPPPPPNHFKGKDKITIHESTKGDGVFDKCTVFVEGLNIATAAVRGRGGVWVLNPPYLLFYPTKDNADKPTGDPVVHLQGFGLEDCHSVVNSLRWGPDGWLYAAQGSTVTANVQQPGSKAAPIQTIGQNIWRYQPEKKIFEVFAEGGGNAFGVEIDARGRVFSGHNGGDTRGFQYVQGGYYRKGFEKHGVLSNPFTFGYFEAMKHNKAQRFTHNFIIYEAAALPEKYRGKLFGVAPLQSHVMLSDVMTDTSSLQTKDIEPVVSSSDVWFRPVDIKLGPDGAIYVADFYEPLISHRNHYEGQIDVDSGRIYRLSGRDAEPKKPLDLGAKSSVELIEFLKSDNRTIRQTALRLLGDRRDADVVATLKIWLKENKGQLALESLWAVNLSGGLTPEYAEEMLKHAEPAVREWTVRLLCDENRVGDKLAKQLAELARVEKDVHVRSQLAASARRLPASEGLPIVRRLLAHDEDLGDIHVPLLLWWAIEARCAKDREAVVAMFRDKAIWQERLVQEIILSRLMRRFAAGGTQQDLATCTELLRLAPEKAHAQVLLKGFEEAFKGRSIAGLPDELLQEILKLGGGSLAFGVRQGKEDAVNRALDMIRDAKAPVAERIELIEILGEAKQPRSVAAMITLLAEKEDLQVRKAALTALQAYSDSRIGAEVVPLYPKLTGELREIAETLLVSRKEWANTWLEAVDAGKIEPKSITRATVRQLLLHKDEAITDLVRKHWGELKGATTEDMQKEIDRVLVVIGTGGGDPASGKKLFTTKCAVCHKLHGEGGTVGPDLTSFKRDDAANLVLNIVNPSAEIREGYESTVVNTKSGRTLTGIVAEKDARVMVLRTSDGSRVVLSRDDIDDTTVSGASLMPEGLLEGVGEKELRDLFAYLRTGQPLN